MHAIRYLLHKKNYDLQKMNPNLKPVFLVGENDRVLLLKEPRYWQSEGNDYVVVITKLISRMFLNVSEDPDLVEYIAENTAEDSEYIFIEQSISGVSVCREILQATNEEHLMHPVVGDSDPEQEEKEVNRYNYTITYQPVSCDSPDCSLDWTEIQELKQPKLLILGESIHDDEKITEMNARYAKRRKLFRYKRDVEVLGYLSALNSLNEMREIAKEVRRFKKTPQEAVDNATTRMEEIAKSVEQLQSGPIESDEEIDKKAKQDSFREAAAKFAARRRSIKGGVIPYE
jgi:hypothetical protein